MLDFENQEVSKATTKNLNEREEQKLQSGFRLEIPPKTLERHLYKKNFPRCSQSHVTTVQIESETIFFTFNTALPGLRTGATQKGQESGLEECWEVPETTEKQNEYTRSTQNHEKQRFSSPKNLGFRC